ncbi:MAG: GTPase [Candidatus Aminicenantes bacterium]|nr:MAG: GTPase [Candidatus Aminicenantes bacterium]
MKNAIIMGAAGRDFHNFNVFFRDNEDYSVRAFTATQIPDIEDRKYPTELAGELYPHGIPIFPQEDLKNLIRELDIEEVYFSYSDVPHTHVMHLASAVQATGASFNLLGPDETMIKSQLPVISVCAVRTGCGKSQTTRKIALLLKEKGHRVVVIRHPMPYGDLIRQKVQRFATYEDMIAHECSIEEMEEYEPHISNGILVYAGVDYGAILRKAEKEADIILWDGGNNDIPFYRADLEIVVVDPHRPGHELAYYPGETNFRRADVLIINKMDTAKQENVKKIMENIQAFNPRAAIVRASSPITVPEGEQIQGKTVLVVEDGPTLTHGEMAYGAGIVAAEKYGASNIVDPRPYAVGSIQETFAKYTHLDRVLPAMGYGQKQIAELSQTIEKVECDLVIGATPIDLRRLIQSHKKILRVTYDLEEIGMPDLKEILKDY